MDPFVGEIRIFAGTYAPNNWAFCNGAVLPVNGNETLFSLIGSRYGGNGSTTFALPDMRGRLPMHQGAGPGLSPRALGSIGGTEYVTLTNENMPTHKHMMAALTTEASGAQPVGQMLAMASVPIFAAEGDTPTESMPADMVGVSGMGDAHFNLMPFLCLNYIIALKGIYPNKT